MASRFVRVDSIKQARELLELGLLYENYGVGRSPDIFHLCDELSTYQLDELESGAPTNWPLSDYAYILED